MDLGLTGKVAIVTGSARGLGAATARRLAEEGAKVIITDINAELAQATTAALKADGLAAHCIVCDITKGAEVQQMVDHTVATFGGVHILVNNAGFPRDKLAEALCSIEGQQLIDLRETGAG